ncbi:hypothetical protein N1027_15665 [Herbiconiux sp. CPCC 205763]|uniref:Protein kinase domain-containing protein n=1 Tax=Herbiconiux aconitum TaxID=2970913 RepID=A0ABT2GTM8_9MICO|nr:hypothetical protein [Herbiconiux aconitum]MCS5719572.1 hypothetical protein [Herbiconiux aconitum]
MTTHAPSLAPAPAGPAVAGYRLDELIGIGASANVYAGVLDVGGGVAGLPGSDPVAVKLCLPREPIAVRGDVAPGAGPVDGGFGREAECRALALRPIAPMPRLLDLATTDQGELVLVMTFCRGRPVRPSAPHATRPALDAGDLARLVRELHEAGVAHGSLDPGAVLVDDQGVASLVGFRAARFAGDAGFAAAVSADLRAVEALTRGRPAVVGFSTARAAVPGRGSSRLAGGPERLFSNTGGVREADDSATSGGVVASSAGAVDSRAGDDSLIDAWRWTDDTVDEPGRELAFLETLEPAVLAIRESGAALRGLVRTRSAGAMAPRRRRLLVAGGALVVAAAVAGCLMIPSGGSSTDDRAAASAAERTAPAAPEEGSVEAGAGAGMGADTAAAAGAADNGEADRAAIRSDDPLRAMPALLELRRECLRTGEPNCLDSVDQWNASALVADQELARGSGPPDDPLASVSDISLVERIGATALLSGVAGEGSDGGGETTKPVSLLVMRGETGWRLRSYRIGQGPD